MNRLSPESAGAVALLTAAMFGLLAMSERAGLPLGWVRFFLCVLAALVFLLVTALGRTALERLFFGEVKTANALLGGLAVGALQTVALDVLLRPADGNGWLAVMAGSVAGLVGAQALMRFAQRSGRMATRQQVDGMPDLLRGAATMLLGLALLLATAGIAGPEAARLFGLSQTVAPGLVLLVALVPVLAGGGHGATTVVTGLAATAIVAIAMLLVASGAALGPLPLPGQSDAATLEAIAAARASWQIERPLHLMVWPGMLAIVSGPNLQLCGLSACLSFGLAMAVSPAIPMARRTTTAIAVSAAIILPIAFVALAGYAIEAAAVRFLGVPMAKPPASMVGASQLGLIVACGAEASTAEAIRTACGVSPRDTTLFAWQHVRLTPAFVESGFAVALGFSVAFSVATSAIKLLLSLALATFGLWFAAKGLGRGILARHHTAAGLASLRMGQTRLACVLVAIAAMVMAVTGLALPREALVALAVAGAFLTVVAAVLMLRRPVPSAEMPVKPPRARRRRKAAPSPESEAA
jgi:hypothetical protein